MDRKEELEEKIIILTTESVFRQLTPMDKKDLTQCQEEYAGILAKEKALKEEI